MGSNYWVQWIRVAAVFVAAAVAFPSDAIAVRVGYQFQGNLIPSGSGTEFILFGVSVPKNSPVVGTFTYDTTAVGVDGEPGVKNFAQLINGGLKLNINNGAIRLSAKDYKIVVANDFPRDPTTVDLFSVDFDSRYTPTPSPILVNGEEYGGSVAYVKVEFSWPAETFIDQDEPKLTPDRPLTPGGGTMAFVGSSGIPRFFSITSISAITVLPGDYNFDGTVDNDDYHEWRRVFGDGSPNCLYADGNGDGNVDSADFVVWRKAMPPSSAAAGQVTDQTNVPEPAGLVLVALICLTLYVRRHKVPCQLSG
jgi:hypothetical protein